MAERMRLMLAALAALAASVALVGCTTETEGGSKVRVVSEPLRQSCKYFKLITVRASLGPDKPGQVLKKAMNETSEAGGDSLFIINNTQDVFDGASLSGEALLCAK